MEETNKEINPSPNQELQNSPKKREQASGEKLRMMFVVGVLFLLAGVIVIKLSFIQIIDASEYQKKARKQYEYDVPVKANRGAILDRNGKTLATSVMVISFAADPKVISNADTVAEVFASHFGKSKKYYLQKLSEKNRFVWLERQVPMSVAKKISELEFAGIIELKEPDRHYENLASQVIGFTDADGNGISGLEKLLDKELRGKDGTMMMQKTATGRAFPAIGGKQVSAMDGNSLELTIDSDVQAIVEDELQRGLENSGSSAGMAIVMDVKTGEILAMANAPDFDMNDKRTMTFDNVRNRTITDAFEPGSTFKLVMAAAATELGVKKADDMVNGENGKMKMKDRVITDHEKLGKVTFRHAIALSSNIVAAKTAIEIGKDNYYKYAKGFGFGEKTGIDLLGEVGGTLKPVNQWSGISLPWMAQGYEVLITPIQLISAYAALANDGIRMQPYLVKRVVSPKGKELSEKSPKDVQRVMKKESAKLTRELFKAVVDSGTGIAAQVEGLPIAGKTGTAQQLLNGSYKSGMYLASFVGFFPVEKPEIAMLVMMQNPKNGIYGSMASAPVFGKISGRILSTLGEVYQNRIAKQLDLSQSPIRNYLDTVKTVVVPNVCGLSAKEAKELLQLHKLDFSKENDMKGAVVRQGIEAGKRVEIWTKVPLKYSGDGLSVNQNQVVKNEKVKVENGKDIKNQNEKKQVAKTVIEKIQSEKMPQFVGLRADRAIYAASQLGLKIECSGNGGKVITQFPKAGSPISIGQSCSFVVN